MLVRMKKIVFLHRQKRQAEIAQLVEHDLAKVGVASSSLVFRSKFCGNSSVGRARPCQGRGREFESRFPLEPDAKSGFFVSKQCLSGGIGRHEGLKIPWPLKPCRFDPGLGYTKASVDY